MVDQAGEKTGVDSAPKQTRAAEYVRMSTEHQRYSTENQGDAIRAYAELHNIVIVQTYADAGKSGLNIAGRDALKQLIEDVQSGQANFSTILVYDVSRWGRFQDADESAYYEYVCKRAGISVEYCAEQFANDGSPVSTIVKSVKRAMAGEYSRELSAKVFAGQCRLIELGYRQGGPAGYGLRRRLVDQSGAQKMELVWGEQKSLQTDRVILVPGPSNEIDTVRWIYRSFVEQGMSEREIAGLLNERGTVTDRGRAWTRGSIHQILVNEKYIGNNVWNRVSFKLKKRRVRNIPKMLIRSNGAFDAIVDPLLFEAAHTIISERSRKVSNDEMLDALRTLLLSRGYLSGLIIDECEGLPSTSIYQSRFGSLLRAYQLVGYSPDRDYRYVEINRQLRTLHPDVIAQVTSGIVRAGGSVSCDPVSQVLTINREFTIAVLLARCSQTDSGSFRWQIRFDTSHAADITVAIRMDPENREARDYYVLPRNDMTTTKLRLAEHNGFSLDIYRFDSLEIIFELAERTKIPEAA